MPKQTVAQTIIASWDEREVLEYVLSLLYDAHHSASPESYEARLIEEAYEMMGAFVRKKYGEKAPNIAL